MNRWLSRTAAYALAGATALVFARTIVAAPPPSASDDQAAIDKETVSENDFQRQLDQFEYASRISVNTEIPADQRLLLDYGALLSFNYLAVDDPAHNTHILRDGELVGYADLNLDNVQEVFVRGHVGYKDYAEGDQFGGGIEEGGQHSALDQAFYRFDLQKYLGSYQHITTRDDAAATLGRQTVVFGNGLAFNQNIDGGVLNINKGLFSFEGVAGITVPDTIDFDTSRPGFDDRTARGFFGAEMSYQLPQHRPFLYFLSERDYNSQHALDETIDGTATVTHFDYNSMYVGAGSTGAITDRLAYSAEGVLETGNGLSNSYIITSTGGVDAVPQRYDDITAIASDAHLDYLFADPHNSHASADLISASGDHNRVSSTNNTFGGNTPGTRDLAFNGFGLLNTGLAFAPQVSNVLIQRVGITTQPFNSCDLFRKLEIGADIFTYEKYLERAPIDEPSHSGGFLGWEPDFFLNWQITSDVTLAMRYGCFLPSDRTIGEAESGKNSSRQLFFTGVTFAF
jgi:hypothetical protein